MTAEAAFSSTAKDSRGNLHTIRGDNYDEFSTNVVRALGDAAGSAYLGTFVSAFGGNAEASALANVQATFPQASTVGQPLPQPGVVAAPPVAAQPPAAAPAGPPPTLTHPGNCAHGAPYVYKDTVGKNGPWRRWECSVPWSKDAVGRCKNVNV